MPTRSKPTTTFEARIQYLDWKAAVLNPGIDHRKVTAGAAVAPSKFYTTVYSIRIPGNPNDPLGVLETLWQSFNGTQGPHISKGIREMCIGDVVVMNGVAWYCDFCGWTPVAEKPRLNEDPAKGPFAVAGDTFIENGKFWNYSNNEWKPSPTPEDMEIPKHAHVGYIRHFTGSDSERTRQYLEFIEPKCA